MRARQSSQIPGLLIDSGSTLNLLDEDLYNNLNTIPQLSVSDTKIYPYQANKPLAAVLGTFKAVVSTKEKQVQTKFYVVKGKSGAILGKSSAEKLDML